MIIDYNFHLLYSQYLTVLIIFSVKVKTQMKSIELFLALALATAVSISGSEIVNANEDASGIEELNGIGTLLVAEGGEGGEGSAELSPGEQANADFQDKMSGAELLSELQNGGYVVYFRHAQTEKDYADQVTANVKNCSTQ